MSKQDTLLHIRVVGWLHIVWALILAAGGMFLFLLFAGIGAGSGDAQALGILGAIGFACGVFMFLVALPGFLAGYGILNLRPWARILGIVVGILDLAAVPVGTVIGGYTLWILFEKDTVRYFEEGGHADGLHEPGSDEEREADPIV